MAGVRPPAREDKARQLECAGSPDSLHAKGGGAPGAPLQSPRATLHHSTTRIGSVLIITSQNQAGNAFPSPPPQPPRGRSTQETRARRRQRRNPHRGTGWRRAARRAGYVRGALPLGPERSRGGGGRPSRAYLWHWPRAPRRCVYSARDLPVRGLRCARVCVAVPARRRRHMRRRGAERATTSPRRRGHTHASPETGAP